MKAGARPHCALLLKVIADASWFPAPLSSACPNYKRKYLASSCGCGPNFGLKDALLLEIAENQRMYRTVSIMLLHQ